MDFNPSEGRLLAGSSGRLSELGAGCGKECSRVGPDGGEGGVLRGSAGRLIKSKLGSEVSGCTWAISATGEVGALAGSAGRSLKLIVEPPVGSPGRSSSLTASTGGKE